MDVSKSSETSAQERDARIALLRDSIRRSFTDVTYIGKVTANDDQIDDPELDEDRDLYEALKVRHWTEVKTDLLQQLPSGYGLLTDEALVAFLPAWLMHALENMDGQNEVRNFLAYSFSHTMRQFRVLNSEQQSTVRSLLVEISETDPSSFIRDHAIQAIALIDRKRY
jgi:hypothetical protein